MATIVERLKYRYKNGDVLVKFLFINITVFFILKVIAIFFLLFNLNRVDPVSYTHLDVYKRQVCGAAGRARCSC